MLCQSSEAVWLDALGREEGGDRSFKGTWSVEPPLKGGRLQVAGPQIEWLGGHSTERLAQLFLPPREAHLLRGQCPLQPSRWQRPIPISIKMDSHLSGLKLKKKKKSSLTSLLPLPLVDPSTGTQYNGIPPPPSPETSWV